MANFFNSVEWPAIRETLRTHFSEASKVVEWEQQEPGIMVLSDGSEFEFNRGAEQGEPLGSLKAALPLGDARGRVAPGVERPHRVCDEWYIDDGQVVCAPALFDPWLRAFDLEIDAIGASRGSGQDVKSSVRLICPPERCSEFDGWATAYVRNTCKVPAPNSPAVALGSVIGDISSIRQKALETCKKVKSKRSAIATLGHAASELVLTRMCADVGNVTYWMRCYGDLLRGVVSDEFDADLRAAVEDTLDGPVSDTAWWQSGLGVADGGLGMRSAHSTALAAFIGSRVASRPLVTCMFEHIESAELGSVRVLLDEYDQRTSRSVETLISELPEEAAQTVRDIVADGMADAARRWRLSMNTDGQDDAAGDGTNADDQTHVRQAGSVAPSLVADAGAEDEEHPNYGGGPRATKVQRKLAKLIDECTRQGLRTHHEQAGSLMDCERLDDLADPGTSHSWLWALSSAQGPIVEDDSEYVEAVRIMIGAGGPTDVAVCGLCGRAQLDTAGAHATCCSLGEATAGHNAIRDCLFRYGSEADPATEWEPQDLVSSQPRARPADVLTPAAFAGCVAALDVGVVSPAAHPGTDAAEAMFTRKCAEREPIRAELEQQNIQYRPVIWTTYGRPHWQATAAMKGIAKRIGRRRGCKAAVVFAQMQFAIGVCLARRAARMSLACRPRPAANVTGAEVAAAVGIHFDFDIGDNDVMSGDGAEDTDVPMRAAQAHGSPHAAR